MRGRRLILVFLLVWLAMPGAACAGSAAGESSTRAELELVYYYFNPCESCQEFARYAQALSQILESDAMNYPYRLTGMNGFKDSNISFNGMCDDSCIPPEERRQPMLVCGSRWLNHDLEDANTVKAFIEACLSEELPASAAAAAETPSSQEPLGLSLYSELEDLDPADSTLLFFTTAACAKCETARAYLQTMPESLSLTVGNREITSRVRIIEWSLTKSGAPELIQFLFERFGVPEAQRQVPILFYNQGYLSGQAAIEKNLPDILEQGQALRFTVEMPDDADVSLSWRDVPAIVAAGLVGGINPCSLSILLLLVSLLAAKKNNVLRLGFIFIATRMAVYFLIGIAFSSLVSLLSSPGYARLARFANWAVIVLLFLLVVGSLYDFFAARREKYGNIKLQLPLGLRQLNRRVIEKVVGSGSTRVFAGTVIALGAFLSLGEFLCTGQVYLASLVYLLNKPSENAPSLYIYLSLYVVAMAIPAMILTLLAERGKQILFLSETIRKHLPAIKLLTALFFLAVMLFLIHTL